MVSFFGLKFGADKRKKRVESPPQLAPQWSQAEEYIGRRESYFPFINGNISRPRTSQGTHGPRGLYPGDPLSQQSDSDFKGIRAVLLGTTAAVPAGTGPVLSPTLKTFSSDSNLRVSLGTKNLSSTSLQMPPRRLGEAGSETGPRPGTAHSMRGSGSQKPPFLPLQLPNVSTSAFGAPPRSPLEQNGLPSPGYCDSESSLGTVRDSENHQKPNLHIDLPNMSTSTFGGTPKSPLGQYEFTSPLKSDTDSLLGDDPGKIVDEIAARITREEALSKPQVSEDRRRLEAELEEQRRKLEAAKKNLEAARLRMAYPSPPSSIGSEHDMQGPGRKPSIGLQAPPHPEGRRTSPGVDKTTFVPSSPVAQTTDSRTPFTDENRTGNSVPTIEAPLPSSSSSSSPSKIPPPPTSTTAEETREQSNTPGGRLSRESHMLHPQQSREHLHSATVPGTKLPPRSPLFQQMSPFDMHSDEDYDDEEHMVDHRAANAPYGLPSPPLSHHQRPSKDSGGGGAGGGDDDNDKNLEETEEEEGLPVLRTVQAKRDTTLVGAAGRTSLGLQIEEFEKSLQQAQAMSALEKGSEIITTVRSRADSNTSSIYSALSDDDDAEESPMIIEPPLISPKPFPLSPRPMGPRASTPADAAPTGRPLLEVRSESPFGSFFDSFVKQNTAGIMDREEEKERRSPATPPAGRLLPRLGAVKPSRPELGEYGTVKITKVATLAGRRVPRPGLDEYGVVSLPRGASNGHDLDSPTLKDVRQNRSPGLEDMMDGRSSTATSRTTSPIAAVSSYSVFSPPPPSVRQRPTIPSPRSMKQEWYGPAPSAPPKSPLPNPIPEKSSSSSSSGGGSGVATPRRVPTTPQPVSLAPATPGLRTSPSIVPNLASNPNWPLPPPTGFASPPEAGFTARRSLQRDGRAPPPAPINVMATRYADEVGGEGGPWTPQIATPTPTTTTAGGAAGGDRFAIRSDFSGWKEEPAPNQRELIANEENSGAIGVARGLSIKFDKIRERERRVRGHDQMKRMAIVTVDEDAVVAPGPVSPTVVGEPFDRLRRPNHGLKSPMGFADEQGIRFI